MSNLKSLQKFPCDFIIKVVGKEQGKFQERLVNALQNTFPDIFLADKLSSKLSSNGHFISLTLTMTVTSQEQLDTVYRFITAFDGVVFTI